MKRRYIVPIAVLVLSILSSVIMVVFTTEFTMAKALNNSDYNKMVKNGKYVEIAHKVNPSFSTMSALNTVYSNRRVYCLDEGYTFVDENLTDEAYLEKMVKYSKEYYDCVFSDGKRITFGKEVGFMEGGGLLTTMYPIGDWEKSMVTSDYAMSLYLAGKGEESKKIIDSYVNDPNIEHKDVGLYSYVIMVHRLEFDEDFQKWMVEVEEKASEEMPDAKYENAFWRNGENEVYKPFDWQK